MKKNLRVLCARFLTALLLITTIFSGVPKITAFAATDIEEAVSTKPASQADEIAIQNALAAINKANQTGAEVDIAYAESLIMALSPINRLRLYIRLSKSYYLKNYKGVGAKYFNAEKYLLANEYVRTAALLESHEDLHVEEKTEAKKAEEKKQEAKDTKKPEEFIVDNGEYDGDDYYDDDDEPYDPSDNYRSAIYINNKSLDIIPYELYINSFNDESFSFTTYNLFDDINNNKNVNVLFRGENYRRAFDLADGKKYTLMLYFCGTDLERNESNRSLSGEVVRMLQADMSNVNVILCVGGTTSYGNTYMNEDAKDGSSFGASGLRSGIYYLNPDGLSKGVRDKLKDVNVEYGEPILQLSGESKETSHSQGLHFDDIITADSLIQLVSTSAVDMADPAFLAGFMNLCTNLFPANDYGLALSDHGGGLEGGVIYTDELYDGNEKLFASNHISVYKLESALASTDLYKNKDLSDDGKLSVLFFNACLMGSTGQAYTTKDYYRYMIASEEISSGHTPYNLMISSLNNDVAQGKSDRDIAINFTKAYESFPETHHGHNRYYVGSVATFSSEDLEEMRDSINDLAREFSEVIGTDKYSANFKQDVFMAIRQASLSCYPTSAAEPYYYNDTYQYETKYVDIGELLNFVSDNLAALDTDDYSDSDIKELFKLQSVLDYTLSTGFLTYLSMYNKETGGIFKESSDGPIPLNYEMDTENDLWTDIRAKSTDNRDYLYGSSIYMPLKESVADFKNSNYYSYYKDTELDDYVEFVNDYLKYYNDKNGYAKQIDDLYNEMYGKKIYTKLITQMKTDSGSVVREILSEDNNKREFISFKVADSYEEAGLETPEHSTGNPMLDILETQTSIKVAAVHKQTFDAMKDGEKGVVEVDMVCAEVPVPPFSVALESNTISFDITDVRDSIISGMTLEGDIWDAEDGVGEYDWQFVLSSYIDADSSLKRKAMQVLIPDYDGDVKTVTVTGSTMMQNVSNEQYSYKADTIHVFKQNEGNKYDYCGSLRADRNNDETNFSRLDDVVAISAYHWVIKEETDDDGNVTNISQAMLENYDGFKEGYFAVKGGDDKLMLYTDINIADKVQKDSYSTYSAEATAYYIDPLGNGSSYSQIGYVEDTAVHETGLSNLGNGPLEVIDMKEVKEDQLEQIGEFIYLPEDWADTDKADDAYEEELPIDVKVGEAVEAAETVELVETVEAPEVSEAIGEVNGAKENGESEEVKETEMIEEPKKAEGNT